MRVLADKVGVSIGAVSAWEIKAAIPETANLIAISKAFNIRFEELQVLIPDRSPGSVSTQSSVAENRQPERPSHLTEAAPTYQPPEPGKEGIEMRVARLCAGIHRVIEKGSYPAEAAIMLAIQAIFPEHFQKWEEIADEQIEAVWNAIRLVRGQLRKKKRKGGAACA